MVENLLSENLCQMQTCWFYIHRTAPASLELAGFQQKHYLWGVFRARQNSGSGQMVSNRIKSWIRQIPGNVLAARDPINLVKAKTWHAEGPISPLSNSASVINTNDDVEDNLAEPRRSNHVRIPSRKSADIV